MNRDGGSSINARPRAWLAWLVSAISVLLLACAAAIALFIYISHQNSLTTMHNIGGNWFIEEMPKSLPEPGPPARSLYRGTTRRRVLVDYGIEQYRFYGADCVVYQTVREAHHVFAVCGDRVPVGVASANVAPWQFEGDGLRRVLEAHVNNGQLTQTVETLALSAMTQVAQRQPPFRRGWANSLGFDVNHPLIKPVQSEMPVDVNGRSANGSPPLLAAVSHHDQDVVDALLQAGANVNATDTYGTTALMIAASDDDLVAVDRLIGAGANVNAWDTLGITALMRAADVGNKDVVKRLLAAGADPGLRDSDNRTAAQRIATSAHTDLRDLLQTRSAP